MTMSRISFVDSLQIHAGRPLAICDDGRVFAYETALELAVRLAVSRRRVVVCLCLNDPGTVLGYLALLSAEAVPVMVSGDLALEKVRRLISVYDPDFLWVPDNRLAEFPDAAVVARYLGYSLVGIGSGRGVQPHDSLALLLTTSGSTGSPRLVRQSQENLSANAGAIADYLGLTQDERPISVLPFNYTYGLSVLHSHLTCGAALALTGNSFFDRGFWDFLKAVGATSLSGVPYHYEMLKKLRFSRMDLPSLRTLTQAGGRMSPDLVEEYARYCAEKSKRLFIMYGQTEATARMAYLAPERALLKPGSIGRAIPGGELSIDGSEDSGELVYRGANVALGYAESRADLALGDQWGGVLRTGDLARRDQDGDYYIVGRLARFLKLFGNRVNLQEVEDAIRTFGVEAACAGRDDHLQIFLPDGTREQAQDIKSLLVKHLGVNPVAISVTGVAALPRNEGGKILYAQLSGLEGIPLA